MINPKRLASAIQSFNCLALWQLSVCTRLSCVFLYSIKRLLYIRVSLVVGVPVARLAPVWYHIGVIRCKLICLDSLAATQSRGDFSVSSAKRGCGDHDLTHSRQF